MNETTAIKTEISLDDGFLLFEKTGTGKLQEAYRTHDIIRAVDKADTLCRAYPGIEFILYSGITGKWYSYFKPIN